jgi:pyridoxamine 5'-phosphate oxidase
MSTTAGAGKSETLTQSIQVDFPEFEAPPADPVALLVKWFNRAVELGVREPRALALATVDATGRPSSRVVAISELSPRGLVFTTHAHSRKGLELAQNPRFSGVLYWRETSQQVVVAGTAERLPTAKAEAFWSARPWQTHAMSVASRQSAPLEDVDDLRARARTLSAKNTPLPRPTGYTVYELHADELEFWSNGTDRLHERLHYTLTPTGWTSRRLQP